MLEAYLSFGGKLSISGAVVLTIVVPVHNMFGRLHNLKSWVIIKADEVEVILVHDDDSEDAQTQSELDEIKKLGENIRVIRGNYGGPGAARNAGKSLARGPWLSFADSDDFVYVSELTNLVKSFTQGDFLIVGSYEKYSLGKVQVHRVGSEIDIALELGHWRIVYPRKAIQNIFFPNFYLGEDQVFFAKVYALVPLIHFSSEIIYEYFVGIPGQLTESVNLSDLLSTRKMLMEIWSENKDRYLILVLICKLDFTILKHSFFKGTIYFVNDIVTLFTGGNRRKLFSEMMKSSYIRRKAPN
jgi:glycosyltransferase involved in cell wall biosynthesis